MTKMAKDFAEGAIANEDMLKSERVRRMEELVLPDVRTRGLGVLGQSPTQTISNIVSTTRN